MKLCYIRALLVSGALLVAAPALSLSDADVAEPRVAAVVDEAPRRLMMAHGANKPTEEERVSREFEEMVLKEALKIVAERATTSTSATSPSFKEVVPPERTTNVEKADPPRSRPTPASVHSSPEDSPEYVDSRMILALESIKAFRLANPEAKPTIVEQYWQNVVIERVLSEDAHLTTDQELQYQLAISNSRGKYEWLFASMMIADYTPLDYATDLVKRVKQNPGEYENIPDKVALGALFRKFYADFLASYAKKKYPSLRTT